MNLVEAFKNSVQPKTWSMDQTFQALQTLQGQPVRVGRVAPRHLDVIHFHAFERPEDPEYIKLAAENLIRNGIHSESNVDAMTAYRKYFGLKPGELLIDEAPKEEPWRKFQVKVFPNQPSERPLPFPSGRVVRLSQWVDFRLLGNMTSGIPGRNNWDYFVAYNINTTEEEDGVRRINVVGEKGCIEPDGIIDRFLQTNRTLNPDTIRASFKLEGNGQSLLRDLLKARV